MSKRAVEHIKETAADLKLANVLVILNRYNFVKVTV